MAEFAWERRCRYERPGLAEAHAWMGKLRPRHGSWAHSSTSINGNRLAHRAAPPSLPPTSPHLHVQQHLLEGVDKTLNLFILHSQCGDDLPQSLLPPPQVHTLRATKPRAWPSSPTWGSPLRSSGIQGDVGANELGHPLRGRPRVKLRPTFLHPPGGYYEDAHYRRRKLRHREPLRKEQTLGRSTQPATYILRTGHKSGCGAGVGKENPRGK